MSLIHTCRLNAVSPFEYLLASATGPDAVKLDPQSWMPWNYPNSATTLAQVLGRAIALRIPAAPCSDLSPVLLHAL
jgi:hypothetical protein